MTDVLLKTLIGVICLVLALFGLAMTKLAAEADELMAGFDTDDAPLPPSPMPHDPAQPWLCLDGYCEHCYPIARLRSVVVDEVTARRMRGNR